LATGADTAAGTKALVAAHDRLLADPGLQFAFSTFPKPRPLDLPPWLKAIAAWLSGAAKFVGAHAVQLFWIGLAAAALAAVYLIVRESLGRRWFARRKRGPRAKPVDWRPEAFKARVLLADADRLAAAGRYDEAAHLLLHRSIDDIEERRPRLLGPALTARDIAALEGLPAKPRGAFADIAAAVERSHFAGRTLDARAFAACRLAYEAFAFGGGWA
jgi:hypothetical protein